MKTIKYNKGKGVIYIYEMLNGNKIVASSGDYINSKKIVIYKNKETLDNETK